MKTIIVMIVLILVTTPLFASSDLSLKNIIGEFEQANWSAIYATGPGEGIALSLKISSVKGYRQYVDGAWTLNKLFGGFSSELPWIKQMIAIDRVGVGVWREQDISVGLVAIRTIR